MAEIKINGNIIIEERVNSFTYLRKKNSKCKRKILYINDYGMALAWRLYTQKLYPSHHLWGCVELLNLDYEVIIPEPPLGNKFSKYLKNDGGSILKLAKTLSSEDIIYCAHNLLIWTAFYHLFGSVKAKLVGLLFANEPLLFPGQYDGIIAHTPAALENARKKNKRALCKHISWGMDLNFFQAEEYNPQFLFSCGKTFRDFKTLGEAMKNIDFPLTIVHPEPETLGVTGEHVKLINARQFGSGIYKQLVADFFPHSAATVITLNEDPKKRHSVGLTNAFESMAAGRPLICTRTEVLQSELDIEELGVGLFVSPSKPKELEDAISWIFNHPEESKKMGDKGRRLCEEHFSIERFAKDLDSYFETI